MAYPRFTFNTYCKGLIIASIITSFFLASCITDKEIAEVESSTVQSDSLQAEKEEAAIPLALVETIADTTLISQPKEVRPDLSALKSFKGKYPYEVKLLKEKGLQIRMKELLGAELFSFVKRISQVESPIEIEDGVFYAWAMQAHSGGNPSAVIMVDFKRDVVYVGVRKDNVSTLYSEDGSVAPQKLIDWSNEPTFEELLEAGVFN